MKSTCVSTSHKNVFMEFTFIYLSDARRPRYGLSHLVVERLESRAIAHRKRKFRSAKRQDAFRDAGTIREIAVPRPLHRNQGVFLHFFEPPAFAHHGNQQRRTALEGFLI